MFIYSNLNWSSFIIIYTVGHNLETQIRLLITPERNKQSAPNFAHFYCNKGATFPPRLMKFHPIQWLKKYRQTKLDLKNITPPSWRILLTIVFKLITSFCSKKPLSLYPVRSLWNVYDHSITAKAMRQWRRRLLTCICANG